MSERIPYPRSRFRKTDTLLQRGRKGFALIIALVLMGFLLLLIVGMSTMVWIEIHRVKLDEYNELARQNAKMGILSAIGELQRTLGPDARTSTRADIVYGDAVDSYQSRWTGVWRMPPPDDSEDFPDGIDPRSRPELMTWLVSGNETLPGNDLSFLPDSFTEDSGSTDDTILLLSEAEAGLPTEGIVSYREVRAPRVDITNGSYAWWVEDEGIKYKVSSVAENYDQGASPLLPLGNSAAFFSERFDVDFEQPHSYWDKILSFESIADTNPDLGQLEPHLTLHSYGILADSLRGGLRLDLSAITEMSATQFSTNVSPLLPGNWMYAEYLDDFSFGSVSAHDGKGPSWDLLRQYGTLQQAMGSQGASIRAMERRSDPAGGNGMEIVDRPGIFPVVERFQVYITVRLSEDLTPDDPDYATFLPRLYYLPAVVLWNPYDKPLVANDGLVFRWGKRGGGWGWGHNYAAGTYGITNSWEAFDIVGSGDVGEFPLTHSGGARNTTDFLLRDASGSEGIVIPPGQAMVFSMKQNEELELDLSRPSVFEMSAGFENFGFYVDGDHTFRVARAEMESEDFQGIFIDLRNRLDRVSSSGTVTLKDDRNGDFFGFELRLMAGSTFLQRIQALRFKSAEWRSANRNTVSELSSGHAGRVFGQDPNGPAPFRIPFADLGFPSDSTPALSQGDPAAIGYEVGFQKPDPDASISLHSSFEYQGMRPLASSNPRAAFNLGEWRDFDRTNPEFYQEIVFENQNTGGQANQTQVIETWDVDGSYAYLGYSDSSAGSSQFILFHLPDSGERISSVGQLRHLDLVGNNLSTAMAGEPTKKKLDGGPAFVVGEARADPFIPLSSYEATVNTASSSSRHRHVDHQWLANRQIWDRFFVSTIPQTGPITLPLDNGRLIPRSDTLLNTGLAPGFNRAASELVIDGAFNINSTSIPAWRALLSQFWRQPVTLAIGGSSFSDVSPFIDLPFPLSGPYMGGNSASPALFTGYRHLTEAEIDSLADQIVTLIKERGPFVSLADFINRSINPADQIFEDSGSGFLPPSLPPGQRLVDLAADPRMFGLLQAAIERAGLNDGFYNTNHDYVTTDMPPWDGTGFGSSLRVYPAAVGPFMEGAPGYMTQGKLLQRLGPILSARSDTFRIRAYGDVRNPINNRVEARAYAEAIVQRMPEYVDPADAAETPIDQLSSGANRNLGRQFRIIHFQWLDPRDI